MNRTSIYLDHHATTPVDPRVVEAMLPYFSQKFGNAASRQHVFGWEAEEAVELARAQVAAMIGAEKNEIIFTSGATESNNLALKGVAEMYQSKGRHLITCVTEHKCVLDSCVHLEKMGFRVTYLPVDREGRVDPDDVKRAITGETILVSVMMANNEIGTIHDLAAIGRITRGHGVLLHSDIAQAFGKIRIDVNELNLDLASISGHKIYAPKGVGALYVRRKNPRVKLTAQMDGGGHENGHRSGTLNVAGIVGLGKAAVLCRDEFEENFRKYIRLRNRLYDGLTTQLQDCVLNGPAIQTEAELKKIGSMDKIFYPLRRLPNNLNISFAGISAENLMMAVKEIAVSTGSACMSATREPSYILKAIGLNDELSKASVRFGIGRNNSDDEIEYAITRFVKAVTMLRSAAIKR